MTHLCRLIAIALSLGLWGCGDGSGTSPAAPAPPPLLPLSWNDVPDEITVKEGETETFTATLTAAVDANYSISSDSDAVEVSGKSLRAGVFEGTVTGIKHGEYSVSLTATYTGYSSANETMDIVVEDPFDLDMWRELVFDASDCPTGGGSRRCRNKHDGRAVESRAVRVLPFWPSFNIMTSLTEIDWGGRFSRSQIDDIEDAIHVAVEQLTGRRFVEQIQAGRRFRDEYGWVDIIPVTDDFWEDQEDGIYCGAALVGDTAGFMILNASRMRSGDCPTQALMLHELGHTIGFYHVFDNPGHLMSPYIYDDLEDFSEEERFHALLAQEIGRGAPYTNDPRSQSMSSTTRLELPENREIVVCPLRH
ncbi:MAG: hypothetical protein OYL41_03200 [Acidobacteriota bacterium]|nr:hypothetical protein [Acidobacteriota bacterium]